MPDLVGPKITKVGDEGDDDDENHMEMAVLGNFPALGPNHTPSRMYGAFGWTGVSR